MSKPGILLNKISKTRLKQDYKLEHTTSGFLFPDSQKTQGYFSITQGKFSS